MRKPLAVASVFLAVLLSAGCDSQTPETEPQLRPVRYITIADPTSTRMRVFSGSSKSTQESRLSFKVAGTVIDIPVQVGDQLKSGQVIARLDSSQFKLQVQQSKASLIQAQANARSAAASYERTKKLYQDDNTSLNELDNARANAETTEALKKAAEKAEELAELELSYTHLKSDGDCTVTELSVEVNENVASGNPIAKVNCGEELEVQVNVPENLIASIQSDMNVSIAFDAVAGKRFNGRVTEVGGVAEGGASVFPVVVKVLESDSYSELRAGLAAEVTFAFASNGGSNTHLLPLSAVIKGSDGTFVFVAQQADSSKTAMVKRKAIVLGELTESGMQVLQGLERGDLVITAGVSVIRDGQQVLLQ